MDCETFPYISFNSVKPNTRTHFFCNSDPGHFLSSFIIPLEGLARQSKAQMKFKFFEVETAIKVKLSFVLQQLNQRHSRRERVIDFDNDEYFNDTGEEKELSSQFLQMQKNQLIDLQDNSERYCNTLPLFLFNSAKFDIGSIKSYLSPIPAKERQVEPKVIKKANQFVPFKFCDVQLLDILTFIVEATVLTRTSKLTKQRKVFPLWVVRQSRKVEQQRTTSIRFLL